MPALDEPRGRTAGDLMVGDVPTADPSLTAAACRERLRGVPADAAAVVAVLSGGSLVGLLTAERLLTASAETTVGQLMVARPDPVDPSTPIESAAAQMFHHDQPAVVVARQGGPVLGVVPPSRLGKVLLTEHEEDMARLGGYQAGSRSALRAAEEPLTARLWHRLPWLVVGLAGAMASVVLIGAFEEQLDRVVLLAFFVPAVVYMSSAIGTQTQTLLIRALAADVHLERVIRKELLTGLLLGGAVAIFFYPFALAGWGNAEVALAVSLAMLGSCSIATAIGMALPLLLRRLGFDPAFGSGPLATVLQDLLSILIFFIIGVPLTS